VLLDAGHAVVQAVDGADAFVKLSQVGRPCLILLDLVMPGMDGLEFLAALRDHPHASEFSVLVMSAHSGPTGAEDCPGVVGTLMKPFELSELLFWVKSRC